MTAVHHDAFTTVWLVQEPADATTIAVFDNEGDATALAFGLTAERGFQYGVEKMPVYDRLPADWRDVWKHA